MTSLNAEPEVLAAVPRSRRRRSGGTGSRGAGLPSSPFRLHWLAVAVGLPLIVIPLSFGGVHPGSYLSSNIYLFAVLAMLLLSRQGLVTGAFSGRRTPSRLILACLCLYALWISLSPVIGTRTPGMVLPWGEPAALGVPLQSTMAAVSFATMFVLVRSACRASPEVRSQVRALILFSGVLVCGVAVAHWFSDNGRLFWTFEPSSTFTSLRARWPFVNSNHLGHFTLMTFFLLCGRLLAHRERLLYLTRVVYRDHSFADLAGRPRVTSALFRTGLTITALSLSLIVLIACLSRGTWLSLVISSALLTAILVSGPRLRHSRDGSRRPRATRGRRVALAVAALTVPCAFLAAFLMSDRGVELLDSRLEYALVHSKSDVRWRLYELSLPVLKEHLWTGAGAGRWEEAALQRFTPDLGGIRPVYLHSDPYQLLIEAGLVGALPILVVAVIVLKLTFSRTLKPEARAGGIGLLSLGIVSCFDFPFRIPAIALFAAAHLALLCSCFEDPAERTDDGYFPEGGTS